MDQKAESITLDDRMKLIEKKHERRIAPTDGYIIRLDGGNFSNYTNGFIRPFDEQFTKAMMYTTNDLVEKFHAMTGYTHSDEITLIFPNVIEVEENSTKVHQYNGRVRKLLSVMAGFCSARFNHHIIELVTSNSTLYTDEHVKKIKKGMAFFDARDLVFSKDKFHEIVNHMIWRSVRDCHKNAVSTYADCYVGKNRTKGKNTKQKIAMLLEKGHDWATVSTHIKHGIYTKKSLYEIDATDKKTGSPVKAIRSKTVNKVFKIKFDPQFIEILFAKYWPEDTILCEDVKTEEIFFD
jgi:tRNA(His) guanylyltransferase